MENDDNKSSKSNEADKTWQETCRHAVKAVVSLLAYYPRTFDTRQAGTGDATGFIINAEKGIILTNRHVAGPGPFRGRAIFQSQEEVCMP